MDSKALLQRFEDDGIEHLWVIYHDYSGRSCGKTVPRHRFASILEHGIVFTPANLDFDLQDNQAPGATFLANAHDFFAVPDPETYTVVSYRNSTARLHAAMRREDGSAWDGCPRTRLQRMGDTYAAEGLSVQVAFEPEFILFERDEDDRYRTADTDGMFTVAGLDRHYELWQRVIENLHHMGVSVHQFAKEYGPGQYEVTMMHADPLKAVDDYLTFKEVVRALAREAGWIASFMPKPYADLVGCGLHLHISLWDGEGHQELSAGEAEGEPLSPLGRHFVGGLLRHAPALVGAGSPIVNSYKRLLPGSWAPAHICWGVANRAALVRIPDAVRRRHIEFRSGDNAANPFIYVTAVLAAGLHGITNQIEPPAPVGEDVGLLSDQEMEERGLKYLPRSLPEALAAFEADIVVTKALGPIISSEFVKVKRAEMMAYNMHVHPWERDVYLEAV